MPTSNAPGIPAGFIVLFVIVAIIVIAVLDFIVKRNSIIAQRNRVDESWSGIDVQLKRRHDLVPNLVETVKGYAEHESQTFEKTTQARAAAMAAQGVDIVFAAGNSGDGNGEATLNPFSQSPWVISVAAESVKHERGSFSSNGFRFDNSTAVAPGANGRTTFTGERAMNAPSSAGTTPALPSSPATLTSTRISVSGVPCRSSWRRARCCGRRR